MELAGGVPERQHFFMALCVGLKMLHEGTTTTWLAMRGMFT
jgi:hypothetical protein